VELAIHRPVDFAYSDMGGYLDRANTIIDDKWKAPPMPLHPRAVDVLDYVAGRVLGAKAPYLTLYPHGTHVFPRRGEARLRPQQRQRRGASFAVLGAPRRRVHLRDGRALEPEARGAAARRADS